MPCFSDVNKILLIIRVCSCEGWMNRVTSDKEGTFFPFLEFIGFRVFVWMEEKVRGEEEDEELPLGKESLFRSP